MFLRHPLNKEMVLSCMTHRLTGISLNWDAAFPSAAWFALAVKAGSAVTGEAPEKLEAAIRKCHRDALKDRLESSELELANAKIECQAFVRDRGGTSISIWINDNEARKGIEGPE